MSNEDGLAWAPVPESAGGFLHILLGNAEPAPGPPFVHTLVLPDEGRHWDRFGPDDDGQDDCGD